MLLAGCSQSVGFGLKKDQLSWGQIFANNNGYELTNISVAASSLQHAIHSIIDRISKEDFDVIILQLTTLDRYPISFDGEEAFLSENILKVNKKTDNILHLVPAIYLRAVEGEKLPIKNEHVKFFYEKLMYSRFYLNTIINELYLLQQMLKLKGVDFILIPYDDYFWGYHSYMSIWRLPQSSKIDKSRYIDYPFMQWLKDNHKSDNYYIDKGFHLNEVGHKLFAKQYLSKYIKLN